MWPCEKTSSDFITQGNFVLLDLEKIFPLHTWDHVKISKNGVKKSQYKKSFENIFAAKFSSISYSHQKDKKIEK